MAAATSPEPRPRRATAESAKIARRLGRQLADQPRSEFETWSASLGDLGEAVSPFAGNVSPWYPFLMEFPRRLTRLFSRLAAAGKGLAGKLRRERPPVEPEPAMIGLPPSARGLTGRPIDLALHAKEVAREWEDVAESYVERRMRELGIQEQRIGAPDYDRGGKRQAFLPEDARGGTNDFAGRIYVDSGALNPQLNAQAIVPEASRLWARSRLRERIDAVIAHEYEESGGIHHDQVVERVAETTLPISENARRILRSISEGVRRQR